MRDGEQEFIERLVSVAVENGWPRTGARLFGHLLLWDEARSLDQLVEELGVSKASISLNARWLEKLGVVERLSSPGDRRDYYRLVDDPWEPGFAIAQRRMQRMHDTLAAGSELLPEDAEVGRRRVAEWRRFYAFVLADTSDVLARWRKYRSADDGAGSVSAPVEPSLSEEGRSSARDDT